MRTNFSVVAIAAADARAAIVIHALPPDSAPSLIVVSPDSGTSVPLAPNGSSAAPIQLRLALTNGDPLAGIPLVQPFKVPTSNSRALKHPFSPIPMVTQVATPRYMENPARARFHFSQADCLSVPTWRL